MKKKEELKKQGKKEKEQSFSPIDATEFERSEEGPREIEEGSI